MKDLILVDSRVVGLKQTLRAIINQEVSEVYLANNADEFIRKSVEKACLENNLKLIKIGTMRELGSACGIDREASTAAIIKVLTYR